MSNLNAMVDLYLHPDIPYFDKEHLIVGGVTAIVSTVLFGALFFYVCHLDKALKTIKTLETFLPICCNCKKIRIPDSDPKKMDSWLQIESYITQKTTTMFSHGICPECILKLYPEYSDNKQEMYLSASSHSAS
ncbi:MAG: hypothetical protein FP814_05035 [Desulfobacterium sp.]|nr:hypothetical protein [Desulfobacterium sp.]